MSMAVGLFWAVFPCPFSLTPQYSPLFPLCWEGDCRATHHKGWPCPVLPFNAMHYSHLLCRWLPGQGGGGWPSIYVVFREKMGPARDVSISNSASNRCLPHASRTEGVVHHGEVHCKFDASPLLSHKGFILSILWPRTHT